RYRMHPGDELPENNLCDDGSAEVPQEQDGILGLKNLNANIVRFNRWGTLVAVGATGGDVSIFDFLTRDCIKHWNVHAGPITALSWSRNGRLLLTGGVDFMCTIRCVMTGRELRQLLYSDIILSAQFSPRDDNQFLVHSNDHQPTLEWVDRHVACGRQRALDPLASVELVMPSALDDDELSCVVYDRRGDYVLAGTAEGRIIVYDVQTQDVIAIVRQERDTLLVKSITVPRRGCYIVINSTDRVIRRYDLDEIIKGGPFDLMMEPMQKLVDSVNKAMWKSMCCSWDGDYICSVSTNTYELYIWEIATGSLIRILRGNKTQGIQVMDAQWHPARAVIVSVCDGVPIVWTKAPLDAWTAFAPDFTELEENGKHVEREGEFDDGDEDASDEERNGDEDEEEEIDVVNLDAADLGGSSDEEAHLMPCTDRSITTGPLLYVPITPRIINPEYRRRKRLPLAAPSSREKKKREKHQPLGDRTFLNPPLTQFEDPNDLRAQMLAARTMTARSAPNMPVSKLKGRRMSK
ncbi:hypothetical protein PENTCL1PPCAC_19821, partial [Pristionchus entomophagus]